MQERQPTIIVDIIIIYSMQCRKCRFALESTHTVQKCLYRDGSD